MRSCHFFGRELNDRLFRLLRLITEILLLILLPRRHVDRQTGSASRKIPSFRLPSGSWLQVRNSMLYKRRLGALPLIKNTINELQFLQRFNCLRMISVTFDTALFTIFPQGSIRNSDTYFHLVIQDVDDCFFLCTFKRQSQQLHTELH